MSVNYRTMIVFGWEIGMEQYEEYDNEGEIENLLFEELNYRDKSTGDVVCISDGMAGEYCFFGVLAEQTNTTRDGPQKFSSPVEVDEPPSKEKMLELGEKRVEYGIEVEGEPRYFVFTHVT